MFKMFEAILAERDLFLPNRYCCLVSTFAVSQIKVTVSK